MRNYVHSNETLINRLKDACANLMIELDVVSKRMKDISELFLAMSQVSMKSHDNLVVMDTYSMMANVMDKWGDAHYMTKHIIEADCIEFFSYIRREFNSFKDV